MRYIFLFILFSSSHMGFFCCKPISKSSEESVSELSNSVKNPTNYGVFITATDSNVMKNKENFGQAAIDICKTGAKRVFIPVWWRGRFFIKNVPDWVKKAGLVAPQIMADSNFDPLFLFKQFCPEIEVIAWYEYMWLVPMDIDETKFPGVSAFSNPLRQLAKNRQWLLRGVGKERVDGFSIRYLNPKNSILNANWKNLISHVANTYKVSTCFDDNSGIDKEVPDSGGQCTSMILSV